MSSQLHFRVARLLRWANSNPMATGDPAGFYRLKEAICHRFGRLDGEDIQQIQRECWDCGGSGFDNWIDDYCSRCGGDGIYECVYVRLERWRIAGHVFHRPAGRVHNVPAQRRANIKGKIKHTPSCLAHVAAIALARLFNQSLYWKWLKLSPAEGFGQLVSKSTRLALLVGQFHSLGWRLEIGHNMVELQLPPEDDDR